MKIAVITSGFLPVPATKGGAVETLCENFIKVNEKYQKVKLVFFSIYDSAAFQEAKKYKNTKFIFIKSNSFIDFLDKISFFVAKNILKKKNSHSFRFIFRRLHFINKVSLYLKKNDYDKILIENHTILYLSLKFRKNYKKYNDKYYYHCHNMVPGKFKCDEIIKNTNNIICVSNFRKKDFQKKLNLKDTKFSVVLNSIDSKIINKKILPHEQKQLYKKYNINNNDKILIYTGRFVPGKGIEEIINSLKFVKYVDFKLLIIGSSLNALNVSNTFEEKILNITKDVSDKVIFTGFVNYNELYKFYSIADIAILPSIIDDSAPLTILEALNCNIPIITTDSGGIPEYVNDKCAIILKRNDYLVQNIAKSIDTLLKDQEQRNKMVFESRKVAKNLSLERYYSNMLKEMGCNYDL